MNGPSDACLIAKRFRLERAFTAAPSRSRVDFHSLP
jgi:hypothetical protein